MRWLHLLAARLHPQTRHRLTDLGYFDLQHRRAHALWLVAAGLLFTLAGVVIALSGTNTDLFLTINGAGAVLPDRFWASLTFLGDGLGVAGIALLLAWRYPQLLWPALISALIGTLYIQGLKSFFDIGRPPAQLAANLFQVIGPVIRSRSFPSGHTAAIFGLAGCLLLFLPHAGWRLGVLAVATGVGISRIMVGVHWPVDVCFGAAGGLLTAWIGVATAGYWRVGFHPVGHLLLLLLFLVVTLQLITHDGGYALAGWLGPLLGGAGLAVWLLQWNWQRAQR